MYADDPRNLGKADEEVGLIGASYLYDPAVRRLPFEQGVRMPVQAGCASDLKQEALGEGQGALDGSGNPLGQNEGAQVF